MQFQRLEAFEQSHDAGSIPGMSWMMLSLVVATMRSLFSHEFNCSIDTKSRVNTVQQMEINRTVVESPVLLAALLLFIFLKKLLC